MKRLVFNIAVAFILLSLGYKIGKMSADKWWKARELNISSQPKLRHLVRGIQWVGDCSPSLDIGIEYQNDMLDGKLLSKEIPCHLEPFEDVR